MDLKMTMAFRYLVTREPDDKNNVAAELFVRGNPLLQMIFRVLREEKLKALFGQSIANLGVLCESAAVAGQAE